MTGDKLRFRFAKTGHLRLLSHHDLMRCLERMLRRAAVPFKSTNGFHPTPRLVFALSLPLGVVGGDEVCELELTESRDADETLTRLAAQAPDGLAFTRVSVVPMKVTALPRRVVYTLPLPADRAAETADRCRGLMAEPKVWVDRLRPSPKRLNIRPYFRGLEVNPSPQPAPRSGEGGPTGALPDYQEACPSCSPPRLGEVSGEGLLRLDLWVTQTGTARADELVELLGLADLLDAGAVLTRKTLELRDEVTSTDPTDTPPDGPADSLPLDPATVAELSRREDEPNHAAAAPWGASPAGPVVE